MFDKIIPIAEKLLITPNDIKQIEFIGGMTNKNYLVSTITDQYVVRLPGVMTEFLISRKNEEINSKIASDYGFNVETVYINAESGIKVTRYLENSQTLNHTTIQNEDYLRKIAKRLNDLHQSDISFPNRLNAFEAYDGYIKLLTNSEHFYQFDLEMKSLLDFFNQIRRYFDKHSRPLCPCHNDLVPENILLQGDKLYFIDWEYSGMNDPLFDVAAFLLEARLSDEQVNLFLKSYFNKSDYHNEMQWILLYQFAQDILWTLWTIIKSENNEHFEGYAEKRISHSKLVMHKIMQLGLF